MLKPHKQLPPVNLDAPRLTKTGYFTLPPIRRLKRMPTEALKV